MTRSRKPISFIATKQPDKAKAFYSDIMGLVVVEESPFALVFADGDMTLRAQIVQELSPAPHTVHGWQVSDIQQHINTLTAKGVACLTFDQLDQDAEGIWTTPDGHKVAWFKDPCGNILSLTEFL